MSLNTIAEKAFAGKWIAGPALSDAVSRCNYFNTKGVRCLINYLGEDLSNKVEISDAIKKYADLIDTIKSDVLKADVSLKLTQLGLFYSKDTANRNYSSIVRHAKRKGVFVWIDMEDEAFVKDSIEIYLSNVRNKNVGITIQSYLRRSEKDVELLVKNGAIIRLVKGAYKDAKDKAFQTRYETTLNFGRIMTILFKKAKEFMVATHDTSMINRAIRLNRLYRRKVTYAMLNGIRNKYLFGLEESGQMTAAYVPFGSQWFRYSLRRMREASSAKLIIRSIFRD